MKMLNYNIMTHQLLPSKQPAIKNLFVKNILNITMREENIFKVFELDEIYKNPKVLDYMAKMIQTHNTLMEIMQQIVQYTPSKEAKRLATPVSIKLQDFSNVLYKQISKQYNNINSLLLLHCPYPTVDKLIAKYFEKNPYTSLDYEEILKKLEANCSTIYIRKFIMLGLSLLPEKLFPINEKIVSNERYQQTNKIPQFINMLMSICVWGIHILFEQNHLKHIMFFNPYDDVLLLYYRKSTKGCSKVDFFIALPYTDEVVNNSNVRLKYISKLIQEHY